MFNMQDFHSWLFSTNGTPSAYQRRLYHLARATRAQVLNIAGNLTWNIWGAEAAGA